MQRRSVRPDDETGAHGRGEAGYSLLEAIISLTIAILLIVAVLDLFDRNTRLARVETEQTEMQQSVRAVHLEMASRVRTAGRGGLLQSSADKDVPHEGVVIEVASNVENDERLVAPNTADGPVAVAGTDILTVRGVMTGSIYYGFDNTTDQTYVVFRDGAGQPADQPANVRSGTLHVCTRSPAGFVQDITPLEQAIEDGSEEALMLVGTGGEAATAVVKLVPGSSAPTSNVCDPADPEAGVTLGFVVSGDGGLADGYHELSGAAGTGGLPPGLTSVAFAGIVEEYRYYVREVREDESDPSSPLRPRLTRARLYPNSGRGWGSAPGTSLTVDVADDVLDLQVSLGLDSSQGGGALVDGSLAADGEPIFESEDGQSDDWLFNHPSDDPSSAVWARPGNPLGSAWRRAPLYLVRLTTIGRADFPPGSYEAPLVERIGDRVYDPNSPDDPDSDLQRRYRRWVVTTTVDLRNL